MLLPKIKVIGQTVQPWEHRQTNGQTDRRKDGRTDGCYQVHYFPHFAVDKNRQLSAVLYIWQRVFHSVKTSIKKWFCKYFECDHYHTKNLSVTRVLAIYFASRNTTKILIIFRSLGLAKIARYPCNLTLLPCMTIKKKPVSHWPNLSTA